MKVGEGMPGETIAAPAGGRSDLRDPYPVVEGLPLRRGSGHDIHNVGMGEIRADLLRYPGVLSMQFLLYYNDRPASISPATTPVRMSRTSTW